MLGLSSSNVAFAGRAETPAATMENYGAHLFEWGLVDYGDGHYLAILVGGNTISEGDAILNKGYDYPYTFDYTVLHPWGEVPQLVSIDGVWDIPENWGILPEGNQSTPCIALITNNKILPTKERCTDVISLPQNVSSRDLPTEVRRYLISVGGSGAGAYDGTTTARWEGESGLRHYRKSDNTYISDTWLKLDSKQHYMNEQGTMLVDTITLDGYYANTEGGKTGYIPGWLQDGANWKYMRKSGYYAANQWVQDADGEWYYLDMMTVVLTNAITPDDYHMDANGIWDRQPASAVTGGEDPGPGVTTAPDTEG